MHNRLSLLLLLGVALCLPAVVRADVEPPRESGLCVVIPATTADELIARSNQGRVLVHALTTDAATAIRLREQITRAGSQGVVSVMVWNDFPKLPYAEELINQLIVDRDALPKGPSDEEIQRVLVPQWGTADVRTGGRWERRIKPLPPGYGQWTHYFHDATNNPVSKDTAEIATGIRWITGAISDGESHSYFGSGVLVDVSAVRRTITGTLITAREAFNGLPVWRKRHGDGKRFSARRYEVNIIVGERLIRLRSAEGPLVGYSLRTGEEEIVYDAIPIRRLLDGESGRIAAGAAGGVSTMAVVHEDTLYVVNESNLVAMDVQTGKLKWKWKSPGARFLGYPCVNPKAGILAVGSGDKAMAASRVTAFIAKEFHGIDLKTGKTIWSTPSPIDSYLTLFIAYEGSFYTQTASHLGSDSVSIVSLDAASGKVIWSHLDQQMPGVGVMMAFPERLYVVHGSVYAFERTTGERLGKWTVGNTRCDAPRASEHYIYSFGNFFDVRDKNKVVWERREVVRNSCGGATLPAYGIRYSTDNRCSCFEAVRGRVAQTATPMPEPTPDDERLVKGEAYARPLRAEAEGWTALLGSDRRTGAGPAIKRDAPVAVWKTKVSESPSEGLIPEEWRDGDNWNGPITSPTVADGRVYVAETVGHRLACLDANTGEILWRFPVDGRIDGPPRITRGRVVFGSRDGHVYCLDAADGKLAWRFQAAPGRRLICAFGQLESAWPLRGSLAVVDGVVIAPAGYHPESDTGIALWGLDLASGQPRWRRTLDNQRPVLEMLLQPDGQVNKFTKEQAADIFKPGRVSNVEVVANGKVARIGSARFFAADGTTAPDDHPDLYLLPNWNSFCPPHRRPIDYNPHGPGAYSARWGLTGSKLYTYAGEKKAGKPGVPGRPICLDDSRIVIQGVDVKLGRLVCYDRAAAETGVRPIWEVNDHMRGERGGDITSNSMVLAGDRIIMTGTRFTRSLTTIESGPLEVRSLTDGKLLHSEELPHTTVDHGIAVTGGRIYMSLVDGSVVCME